MITVFCINNKGQYFEKVFDSYWQARVFILRCQHGKNVAVKGIDTVNKDCEQELEHLVAYGW